MKRKLLNWTNEFCVYIERMYWFAAVSVVLGLRNLNDEVRMLEGEAEIAIEKVRKLTTQPSNSYMSRPSIHIPQHQISVTQR